MPHRPPKEEGHYDLEKSIGYVLNRAAQIVAAKFSDALKPHDISLQDWRILAALSELGNQTVSELADHTGAELSYLSRSVVVLVGRGLVERGQSETDKRAASVSLTNLGLDLVRELAPRARSLEKVCLANVSAANLKITLGTLQLICQNLVASEDGAGDTNKKLTVARRVRKRTQLAQDKLPR
jgi:DNA-binding MarR family transcriptional regulator